MSNSTKSESEYSNLLARIVKGAEYLDNPLITETDKAKGMKLYDALVEELQRYRDANRIDDRVRTKSA